MVNNKDLDNNIKKAIEEEIDNINAPADMYSSIEEKIKAIDNTKSPGMFTYFLDKKILAVACIFLFCFGLTVFIQPNIRAFASNTINAIKTIFVVEKVKGEFKLVEKDIKDAIGIPQVGGNTPLSDSEIEKKAGYKVYFPKTLENGYCLSCKTLSVVLNKKVDYITFQNLGKSMVTAVTDDTEFKKLKSYQPSRCIGSEYENLYGKVFIETFRINKKAFENQQKSSMNKIETITLGRIQASWIEIAYPDYPSKIVDGIGGADFAKKPEKIVKTHSLLWESNGITYYLSTLKDSNLTKENFKEIAASFIDKQKSERNDTIPSKILSQDEFQKQLSMYGGAVVKIHAYDRSDKPNLNHLESAKSVISSRLDLMSLNYKEIKINNTKDGFDLNIALGKNNKDIDLGKTLKELFRVGLITIQEINKYTKSPNGSYGPTYMTITNSSNFIYTYFTMSEQMNSFNIMIHFNSNGKKDFEAATDRLKGSKIGIFLDDDCISTPKILDKISNGLFTAQGNCDPDEADILNAIINSKPLNVSLEIKDMQKIKPD